MITNFDKMELELLNKASNMCSGDNQFSQQERAELAALASKLQKYYNQEAANVFNASADKMKQMKDELKKVTNEVEKKKDTFENAATAIETLTQMIALVEKVILAVA